MLLYEVAEERALHSLLERAVRDGIIVECALVAWSIYIWGQSSQKGLVARLTGFAQ